MQNLAAAFNMGDKIAPGGEFSVAVLALWETLEHVISWNDMLSLKLSYMMVSRIVLSKNGDIICCEIAPKAAQSACGLVWNPLSSDGQACRM